MPLPQSQLPFYNLSHFSNLPLHLPQFLFPRRISPVSYGRKLTEQNVTLPLPFLLVPLLAPLKSSSSLLQSALTNIFLQTLLQIPLLHSHPPRPLSSFQRAFNVFFLLKSAPRLAYETLSVILLVLLLFLPSVSQRVLWRILLFIPPVVCGVPTGLCLWLHLLLLFYFTPVQSHSQTQNFGKHLQGDSSQITFYTPDLFPVSGTHHVSLSSGLTRPKEISQSPCLSLLHCFLPWLLLTASLPCLSLGSVTSVPSSTWTL